MTLPFYYLRLMIDQYVFGKITIEGKVYTADCMLFHDPAASSDIRPAVRENWRRSSGHLLVPGDMKEILDFLPQCVIIGQGAFSVMKISDEARQALEEAGIEGIFQETGQACRTFNALAGKKKIAAGFHLTC